MMIKGTEAETNKLSDIIRRQCLNDSLEQLSLPESVSEDPSIPSDTFPEEDSDYEEFPTHFVPPPAKGPSNTELPSEEEEEEEILNDEEQPRNNTL